MTKSQDVKRNQTGSKQYDLEERTYQFAKRCRDFVNKLRKTLANIEYGRQLIRASGSVASNYIEANEAISKKDFAHRIKICRKEAKESCLWLRLCDTENNQSLQKEQTELINESIELTKIFGSIVEKSK
jgi:four helix bundle protein